MEFPLTQKQTFTVLMTLIMTTTTIIGLAVLPPEAWQAFMGMQENFVRLQIEAFIQNDYVLGSPWITEKPYSFGMGNVTVSGATYGVMVNGTTGYYLDHDADSSEVLGWCIGNSSIGDTIFLRNGTYCCHDITLKSGITIEGQSMHGTILLLDGNDYLFKSHADPPASNPLWNVTMRNLYLDGNKATYTTGKSLIYGTFKYSNFEHLYVCNGKENNINLTVKSGQYSVVNKFFDVTSKSSDASTFYAYGWTDSFMELCTIHSASDYALYFDSCGSWGISDCYIGNSRKHAILLDSCSEIRLINNQIDWGDLNHINMTASYCCQVIGNRFYREGTGADSGYSAIYLLNSYFNQIYDNIFTRAGSYQWKYYVEEVETGSPYSYGNHITGNLMPSSYVATGRVLLEDATTQLHHNHYFVTEKSGTAEASNDDWIAHGLAGEPDHVTLTIEEVDANYYLQLKATNVTHFQIYLYDATAGAAEAVDKTINWYAEYRP